VAVQKLLGHAHLSATEVYVSHQSLGDLRAALPGYVPAVAPLARPTFAPPCPPPTPEPTFTTAEAAAILGISAQEVIYHWRQGHLQGQKECGVLRLDPLSVNGLLVEWRTRELQKADALTATEKVREASRRSLQERRAKVVAMRADGHSVRGIARELGLDPHTVRVDLAVMLGERLSGAGPYPRSQQEGL